ncbi:sensor histidine kinase [Promicromonospora iranensis]|uniref:histidine kinase n=1 Tax=Promicromonospora iranensis TaxID=1105144 RepID=A0ABU2CHW6_9MICO|nr:histidine kinase [Promicromonospora iranensis]MDR7380925.1 signal transduction histidine kinase [Promicromonospora iranensis]
MNETDQWALLFQVDSYDGVLWGDVGALHWLARASHPTPPRPRLNPMPSPPTTPERPPRKALRTRLVDSSLIAIAVALALTALQIQSNEPDQLPTWLLTADRLTGLLGCVALWWRRTFPVQIAIALAAASSYSETVGGAAIIALFTVAIHRSTRATIGVCAISLAALSTYQLLWPDQVAPPVTIFTIIALGHAATVAWGLSVRNRRALVTSLRERAAAAEVEAQLRAEHSEREARQSLAREMHDVLGHRLSLLSVHAGALAYARTAPPDDVAQAAEVVRANAHRALQDLREVIGVLRAPVGELPLPDVEDVLGLIDEAREAGTPVELRDDAGVTSGGQALPDVQGRTLYRMVQESLTNARKYAPGAPVVVRITGRPGDHVVVEVVNRPPATGAPAPPTSSGTGLRGLQERARLVSGRLDHGPTDSGGWQVRLRLPWPT